jgi:membrane protease YdiL (CAAX protease family)
MAVGSKTFPDDRSLANTADAALSPRVASVQDAGIVWFEILTVFALLEAVMWTPRSFVHGCLIGLEILAVVWFSFRRHSRAELGLRWPSRTGTIWILALGILGAVAIPAVGLLQGHSIPANPEWPRFHNLWPYVIWAFAQQFLLQSFFFARMESLVGQRWAVFVSTLLFTFAHLPNAALTAMTFAGALFFTEMFRRYRSIYPLGIAHALLGISIAYSFPDGIMHHMRVGLSYWQFH